MTKIKPDKNPPKPQTKQKPSPKPKFIPLRRDYPEPLSEKR